MEMRKRIPLHEFTNRPSKTKKNTIRLLLKVNDVLTTDRGVWTSDRRLSQRSLKNAWIGRNPLN